MGKKRRLVTCIKGSKSQNIIDVLSQILLESRKVVKDITLGLAHNMQVITLVFPEASVVRGRFQVFKLVMEALQNLRIKYR